MPLKKVAHILFLSGAIGGCSAVTKGYAPINGISMYYETYGERRGTPLLLIHGSADSLIPVSHAHAIFAAAREPKECLIIDGVDHCGGYFAERATYVDRVSAFFAQHLA